MTDLTPALLLRAYAAGIFPMADHARDDDLFWVDPDWRGILPLDQFHLPRSLTKTVRHDRFAVTVDQDFEGVVAACAASAPGRRSTWISHRIRALYAGLHRLGHAHSVETRLEGRLVGGLYGVRLGAAFFGESMFSRETDASKVALVHLVARLRAGGFRLLDTQFVTGHLMRFGAIEIPREAYRQQLDAALTAPPGDFFALPQGLPGETVLKALA
ncbi:leucyl/phenylalanyl-tRNA--protein transferase [Zavarzinia compransoris]|uniref:Leucyl/phenylalanyl-tRNA--protein transferase n=1 Tax=Zavarzinia compransoris TaxID=1264899 RepID=A0A317EF70_9PROT|nr:leucyl/phenylalanyl-tRNA--protein transferase [Zavarzinia compransoris]PWR24033.1 leucyl/phenylalanyl-tRNA--protein transferase [Zavarzinia compransoris]TDP48295.1 leucyl/phenylalanyl-tRNA--protein transferase [Zavarzinia compransoris]